LPIEAWAAIAAALQVAPGVFVNVSRSDGNRHSRRPSTGVVKLFADACTWSRPSGLNPA